MRPSAFVLASLTATAVAGPTADKKLHEQIDTAIAQTTANVKDCGKHFTITFDWTAYDAIDWKKADTRREDHIGNELTNIRGDGNSKGEGETGLWGKGGIGGGINKLCADKDYKAALSKIDAIVYKPTDNDNLTVKATIAGKTLTLENYTLGSTRWADDYMNAAKAAL
jgi:hypothetical protein